MAFDTWVSVIFPSEKTTATGLRATDPDPGMSNSTRYYTEGNVLRSHVLAAQQAFDQALALAMSGEGVKVVSEAMWKQVASQASEPARKAAVRQASQKRREIAAALKAEREEREAREKAERNGHAPEITDQDLDAAAEEELALVRASGDPDMHDDPAGSGEEDVHD